MITDRSIDMTNSRSSWKIFPLLVVFIFLPWPIQAYTPTCVGGETGSSEARVDPVDPGTVFTDEEFITTPRPWGAFCCNPNYDEYSIFVNASDSFNSLCNPVLEKIPLLNFTVVKNFPGLIRSCPVMEDSTVLSVPCLITIQGDLRSYLDRKKNCTYAPLLQVNCPGNPLKNVKLDTSPVAILDENVAPEWSVSDFQLGSISELTRAGSLIHSPWQSNLTVSELWDKWSSQNWNISSFAITNVEGAVSDILTVDWDSTTHADPNIPPKQETTVPAIRLLRTIPYRSCQDFNCHFTFTLTAFNPDGMNSSVNIHMSVLDENNLSPMFDQHETLIEMDEDDVAQNEKLLQVHAYDQDVGINCSIRYSLERDVQYFTINESTGQLSLRNPDGPIQWNADNLSGNKYPLLIRATEVPTDDGSCSVDMTATTLVEIIVTSKRAIPIVVTTEPALMTIKKYSFEEEKVGHLNITWNGTNQHNIETEFSFRITQGNEDGSFQILSNGTLIKIYGAVVSDSRVISVEIYDRSSKERYLFTKELIILTTSNGLRFNSAIYEEKVFETSSNPLGEPFHFNAVENLNGPCDNCTCTFVCEELPGQTEQNDTSISVSSWVEDVNVREVYRSRIDVVCEEATTVVFVNYNPRPRFNKSVEIRLPESTPVGNVIGVLRPLHGYPYKLAYLPAEDDFLMVDTEGSGVLRLGKPLVGREEPYETTVRIQGDAGQEFSPELVVPVTLIVFGDTGSGSGSTSTSVSTEDPEVTSTSTVSNSESSTDIDQTSTANTDQTPVQGSTETTPNTSDGSSVPNTLSTPINTEKTPSTDSNLSTETSTDPGLTLTPGSTGDTVIPESDGTTSPIASTTEQSAGSTTDGTGLLSSSTVSGSTAPIGSSESTDLTDTTGPSVDPESTLTSFPDSFTTTSTVTSDATDGSWTSVDSTTEILDSTPDSTLSPTDSIGSTSDSSDTFTTTTLAVPAETTAGPIGVTSTTDLSDTTVTAMELTSPAPNSASSSSTVPLAATVSSSSSTASPNVYIMANLSDDFTDDQKKYFSFNGSTSELEIKDILPPNTPFDLSFSARSARQTRSDSDSQPRADYSYVIALKTLSYTVLTPKDGLSIPEIMLIVVSCVLFLALIGLIVCAVYIHRYRKQTAIYNQSLRYPEAYGKKINTNSTYNSNVDFGLRANQSANTIGSFKSQSNNGSIFGPRSQSRNQSINPSFARSQSVLENDRVKLVDHLEADRDSNQTDVDQLPNVPINQEMPLGNANVIVEDETHSDIVSFIQSDDEVQRGGSLEPEPDYPVTSAPKSPPPPPPPPPRPDFTLLSLGNSTANDTDNIDSENPEMKTAAWKRSDEPKKSAEPTISAGEIFMTELKGAVSNPYTVLKPLEFEKDTEKTVRFGQNVETISIDSSLDKTDEIEEAESPPVPVNITLSKPPLPPKPTVIVSPAVPKYLSPAKLDAVPAREPPVVSPPAPVYKSSRLVEGNKRVKDDRGKNGGTIVKRQISETKVPPPIPPAPRTVINEPTRENENDAGDEKVEETVPRNTEEDEDRTAL